MLKSSRLASVVSFSLFGMLVIACVTNEANVEPSDAAVGDDSGPDSANDSALGVQDSAVDPFDGANASCNSVDPQTAPQAASVACQADGGTFLATGGAIPLGHYYLVTEHFNSNACGAINTTTPVYDVVNVTQDGADYILNVGLQGPTTARYTLRWHLLTDGGVSTELTQSDECPHDGVVVAAVPFSTSSAAGKTTISWQLPLAAGTNAVYAMTAF